MVIYRDPEKRMRAFAGATLKELEGETSPTPDENENEDLKVRNDVACLVECGPH
jgi:hypothetical protein